MNTTLQNDGPPITVQTCVDVITQSVINRRSSLNLELSVCLAVFVIDGTVDRATREMLYGIYASAGYDCLTSQGRDYKTVHRHINAAAALYERLGPQIVGEWAIGRRELILVSSISVHLEEFEFWSITDVLEFCGKKTFRTKRQPVDSNALVMLPKPPITYDRRAEDKPEPGTHRIDTKCLHIVVPPQTSPTEMIRAAKMLLELADEAKEDAIF